MGKDTHDAITKQSQLQNSVILNILAFYVTQNAMTVCHVAIIKFAPICIPN